MNRRGFLNQFLKGGLAAIAAPQVITHGLNLHFRKQESLWIPSLLMYEPYTPEEIGLVFASIDPWAKLVEKSRWPERMGDLFKFV